MAASSSTTPSRAMPSSPRSSCVCSGPACPAPYPRPHSSSRLGASWRRRAASSVPPRERPAATPAPPARVPPSHPAKSPRQQDRPRPRENPVARL
jgi:hypothetical protein